MLRAIVGLGVVGFIFYHSPWREPFAAQPGSGVTAAAAVGLRGALTEAGPGALAAETLGRVLLDNPRVPQRVISLTAPSPPAKAQP